MTAQEKLAKYDQAFELRDKDISISKIAEILELNRSTVSNWLFRGKGRKFLKGIKTTVEDSVFIEAVKTSFSISEALDKTGLKAAGANYKGFHKRVKRLNLDTSHFLGQGHLRGKTHNWSPEISIEKAFVKDGTLQSCNLRRKILKHNLKPYLCEKCNLDSWLGQPISLHLDHINGNNTDNRLENLRFLCPNCHSQTDTYCGKSKGKKRV